MTKAENVSDPQSCLNRAKDDEPIFVLKSTDPLAPALVLEWAHRADLHGVRQEKVESARKVARDMQDWAASHK